MTSFEFYNQKRKSKKKIAFLLICYQPAIGLDCLIDWLNWFIYGTRYLNHVELRYSYIYEQKYFIYFSIVLCLIITNYFFQFSSISACLLSKFLFTNRILQTFISLAQFLCFALIHNLLRGYKHFCPTVDCLWMQGLS